MKTGKVYNILYISHSGEMGGAQNSLMHLIQKLDRNKFNPFVICPSKGLFFNELKNKGFPVKLIRLVSCNKTRQNQSLRNKIKVIILVISSLIKVLLYVNRQKIDIIHTNVHYYSIESGITAKILHVPHILHVRLDPGDPNTRFIFQRKKMLSIFNWYSDKIIAISKAVKTSYLNICDTDKVRVIYNGVDLEKFKKNGFTNDFRSDIGINDQTKIVANISAILPRKRLEDFIRSAALVKKEYPGAIFVIAGKITGGNKEYYTFLNGLIVELQLNGTVKFLGFKNDMPSLFNNIDVLVHTAIYEAFGRVIIEAMAFEKPVIAVDSGALPEIVDNFETGLIANSKDPQDLSEKILSLLNNPRLCNEMGKVGRSKVEEYFTDIITAEKIQSLYISLLMR